MKNEDKKLNDFLVTVFNQILNEQNRHIKLLTDDLTLNEIHVIEAVEKLDENKMKVTMSVLANELKISLGSLTISTDRITKKGYLKKTIDKNDKRIRYLSVTDKGYEALQIHKQWHDELISKTKENLTEEEYLLLIKTLMKLSNFLSGKDTNDKI